MTEQDAASLGERLRKVREDAGLSVRQAATQAGIHHAYLARLENGEQENPSIEKLRSIAQVYSLDVQDLIEPRAMGLSSALPEPRLYFRRKFGMSEDDASILAGLVEKYQKKQKGDTHEEDDD